MNSTRIDLLCQIVADNHLAFLGEMFGPEFIDENDYLRLTKSGLIREDRTYAQYMEVANRIGSVPLFKSKPSVSGKSSLTMGHVVSSIMDKGPLSVAEEEAVKIAKSRVAKRVVNLSQRMTKAVRHELARTLLEKGSAIETAAMLAKITGDASRDWLKIVVSELHTAVQEGKALAISKKFGGDPLIYKRPRPDACPFCKALYLQKDYLTPKVFRYSELIEKGSNESRKANPGIIRGVRKSDDWQPVIGTLHPFCQCELHHLPEGYGFDSQGGLVPTGKLSKAEEVPDLIFHECVKP